MDDPAEDRYVAVMKVWLCLHCDQCYSFPRVVFSLLHWMARAWKIQSSCCNCWMMEVWSSCCCNYVACHHISVYEACAPDYSWVEIFLLGLLEGLMPIAVSFTSLTKSSICFHFNSIYWLKLMWPSLPCAFIVQFWVEHHSYIEFCLFTSTHIKLKSTKKYDGYWDHPPTNWGWLSMLTYIMLTG